MEKRSSGKIGEKHSPEVSRLKKERDEMIVAVERMEQELSQVRIIEKMSVLLYVFFTVARRITEFNRRKRQH